MKKQIFFLILIISTNYIFSQNSFTVDGISYTTTGSNSLEVTEGVYSGSITIPSTVSYSSTFYTVTSIGSYAFYDCNSITSITIPATVTSIGSSAFYNCTSLSSINIPTGVTSIGVLAFFGCTSLNTVNIPATVTSIDGYAFNHCTALINVEIANLYYSSKDGILYNKNLTTLIQCPISIKDKFNIPSTVTSIGDYAFYDCTLITNIIIPASVTSIGNSAFYNCTSLTSINIPASVTLIEKYAFYDCTSLNTIDIPAAVTSIGSRAFSNSSALINVEITNLYYSGKDGVLYNKNLSTLIHCPASVSGEINIPVTVTSISSYAFENCKNLTSVIIPATVTSIGECTFYGCTSLTTINIPAAVTSIGSRAFSNSSGLINVEIDNLNYSGKDGVLYNENLSKLIQCPASVTGEFNIPATVTSIGSYAFENCKDLTSVIIPATVTSIGVRAFTHCTKLNEVKISSYIPPTLGSFAFENVGIAVCTLYIPKGTFSAYKSADQWQNFLNTVEFELMDVNQPNIEYLKPYPNPTSSILNIGLCQYSDLLTLKIFNLTGQKVFEQNNFDLKIQLDISQLSNGTYLIQILDKNKQIVFSGKFIKK